MGSTVKYQRKDFKIVGIFESQGGAFESEIWGDRDTIGADVPARRAAPRPWCCA